MTSILFISPVSTVTGDYKPGVVYSVDDAFAAQMIAAGWAQPDTAGLLSFSRIATFTGGFGAIGAYYGLSPYGLLPFFSNNNAEYGSTDVFTAKNATEIYINNFQSAADLVVTLDDSFTLLEGLAYDSGEVAATLHLDNFIQPSLQSIALNSFDNVYGLNLVCEIGLLPNLNNVEINYYDLDKDMVYIQFELATRGGTWSGTKTISTALSNGELTSASATARAALVARGWTLDS